MPQVMMYSSTIFLRAASQEAFVCPVAEFELSPRQIAAIRARVQIIRLNMVISFNEGGAFPWILVMPIFRKRGVSRPGYGGEYNAVHFLLISVKVKESLTSIQSVEPWEDSRG